MEEELQKRNTDCVYFLASPLTCKKGIECEYRHSDIARLNPRDCWYWLAGNCLNPTCAFRHPPLDGHSEVSSESSAVPLHQSSIPMNKTDVPCYFYFSGFCNKGDRCSFSHGSDDSSPSLKPVKATSPVPDALPLDNKTSLGSETKTLPNVTHPNLSETAPKAPLPLQSELNEVSQKPASILKQYSPLQIPTSNSEEAAAVMSESMLPAEGFVQSMSLVCTDESSDEEVDDHSEPEERWESSPGFDVLVDGRTDNFDYEDDLDYPVAFDRDGRELNSHFLDYGFEGQVESDPKLSEEESLYQHRRYDFYDSVDYGHSSDYGQMAPGRLRDRILDRMLSRKRKLLPVRFAGNGRVGVDLRDHLRNRRGIDNSSSNYLSRRRDSSRLIGQARERSGRHNSGKQLHKRLTSEVGRNMIGSFSGREFLLKGDKGQSWLKHTILHRSRQPFGERRHRKKQRLASEVSKEPTWTESRCTRESSSFTGPKSLAEIREERRKAREKMELARA